MEALNYCNLQSFESVEDCIVTAGRPDIIILDDIQVNGQISGIDFMRIYGSRYPNTEFLFLSSNTNLDDAVSAIRLGAHDYIVKSKIGLSRLVKRVDRIVSSKAKSERMKLVFRAAFLSLGMSGLIFAVAVMLYIS
jgi:DNA-binding NarL/FixJ family response regulator